MTNISDNQIVMDNTIRYCQSCGMPVDITKKEQLGTEENDSVNADYCCYCFKKGCFTFDCSPEQLVEQWVEYTGWYNDVAKTTYTPDEIRLLMTQRIPTLKRWKQKKETHTIHYRIFSQIAVFMNQNLFSDLNIDLLAQKAGFSKYHFSRSFKSVMGESIGSYIQRLRLEYVAHQLLTTGRTLTAILDDVNYQSKHSLSKAFRKHFGISPTQYKEQFKSANRMEESDSSTKLVPEIKWIAEKQIVYISLHDKGGTMASYDNCWREMIQYTEELNLKGKCFISISLDDPLVTGFDKSRFYLGIETEGAVQAPKDGFGKMAIPEGKYAIFNFRGNYKSLPELYSNIYRKWLPDSGYRQKSPMSFEVYLNTPLDTSAEELVTEVYLPVDKI